ncbi:MAG: 7-carboxy-7-deazaguanine synthase QueE [Bacteroidia bacterium]|nr:7-carboxy-7-deazaguanine synthase QueE [Bacteroidia bacterium]
MGKIRYRVMEHFYTLQGEGRWTGTAAYFVRLGGCDVGCVWCDVKESWHAEDHALLAIEEIVAAATASPARTAVVTGGEPTLYDLEPLTAALVEAGFRTHLETSGAHPLTGRWNWVCLSPKKFKPPREDAYALADELKVVVYHPSDLSWAEEHASRCRPQTLLYLQPEWSRHDQSAKLIVEYVKEHPRWRLSLQTHKFVGIP